MIKKVGARTYKKPAIKEAIFEAKFNYEGFDSVAPGQIFEQIKSEYPNKQDIKHELIFLEKDISEPSLMPVIQAPKIRARNEANSELLQFGPGIITANRLKYTSWEDFLPSIKKITRAYLDIVKPQITNRVGIRYINSFLIPEPNTTITDYFKINIDIPENISMLSGFNLLLANTIKDDDDLFNVRTKFLTDTLAPNEKGNKFILDIDCYISPNILLDIEKIIFIANKAHNIVGDIFEKIITDKTRTLMGGEQ